MSNLNFLVDVLKTLNHPKYVYLAKLWAEPLGREEPKNGSKAEADLNRCEKGVTLAVHKAEEHFLEVAKTTNDPATVTAELEK